MSSVYFVLVRLRLLCVLGIDMVVSFCDVNNVYSLFECLVGVVYSLWISLGVILVISRCFMLFVSVFWFLLNMKFI